MPKRLQNDFTRLKLLTTCQKSEVFKNHVMRHSESHNKIRDARHL